MSRAVARLDLFIKQTGLLKQRSEAKQACAQDCVCIDGVPAKASREVSPGEVIAIALPGRRIEAEVLEVPARQPGRNQRHRYVRILRQEVASEDEYLTF